MTSMSIIKIVIDSSVARFPQVRINNETYAVTYISLVTRNKLQQLQSAHRENKKK